MTRYLCPQAEPCPGCDQIDGVEQTSTTPRVQAWKCTRCGMSWAVSVVNPHLRPAYLADLGAAVEEIGRLRGTLRQVIALADDAPGLTEEQLRARLVALADYPANGLSSPDPSSPPRATAFSVLGDKPK